jgi:leucyl-tRNA synthetase
MEFVNLAKKQTGIPQKVAEKFVLLLSPFAPHIAEELWQKLGHTQSLAYEAWPVADEKWLHSDTTTIVIQVNGKKRATIEMAKTAAEKEVLSTAAGHEKVQPFIAGKDIRKEIYVPGRLVNFIVA